MYEPRLPSTNPEHIPALRLGLLLAGEALPGSAIAQGGCTPAQLADQYLFTGHLCQNALLSCHQASITTLADAIATSGIASGIAFAGL